MRNLLAPIYALLAGVLLLTLGQGMLNLLLTVRLDATGASRTVVGAMTSAYYVGFVFGAVRLPRTVARIGHIRTFAALAAVVCATSLAHALWLHPLAWAALRAINGACAAGLLLVVESWLNARSDYTSRGRLLSVYMVVYYLALGSGQLLVQLAPRDGLEAFVTAAVLLALAVVPITTTPHDAPRLDAPSPVGLGALGRRAPLGLAGALASGFVLGAFFGVGPVFAREVGMSIAGTTRLMAVGILGGLVVQWPLGHLSDIFDRRAVLAVVTLGVAPASLFVVTSADQPVMLLVAAVAFGGLASTLYPLSIAHTSDRVSANEIVSASSTLVLVSGLGSVLGPIVAAGTMELVGPEGLFVATGGLGIVSAAYVAWRMAVREPVPDQGSYVPVPRTTPLILELDPRTEEDDDPGALDAPAPGV